MIQRKFYSISILHRPVSPLVRARKKRGHQDLHARKQRAKILVLLRTQLDDDKFRRHLQCCAIFLVVAVVGKRETVGGTGVGLHRTLHGSFRFLGCLSLFIVEARRRLLAFSVRCTVVVLQQQAAVPYSYSRDEGGPPCHSTVPRKCADQRVSPLHQEWRLISAPYSNLSATVH